MFHCTWAVWNETSELIDTAWKSQKVMLHSQLTRPTVTISILFQRPYEGVGKCFFRVTAGGCKKLMSYQTTKGVTAATHTHWNPQFWFPELRGARSEASEICPGLCPVVLYHILCNQIVCIERFSYLYFGGLVLFLLLNWFLYRRNASNRCNDNSLSLSGGSATLLSEKILSCHCFSEYLAI